VSIVVPCYRSAGTLPALVARVNEVMPRVAAAYEVILVVDSTGDGTWEVAQGLAEASGPVRAIQMARNYGQHNAIVAGVRAARYDVVITMDDDLQHLPEQIPVLLGALHDGVDLVYGLPVEEEHGFLRSLASRGIKAGLSSAMGVNNARNVSAFRAFRTFLRNGFDLVSGPHVCVDVALSWATTRVTAVKVQMAERTEGQSGYTFRGLMRHTTNMVVGFSTAPLRMVTYLGFAIGATGLVLFARLIWLYLTGATTVAGFTTISAMVAIFSSAQMIAIGMLGEYVGRIHAAGMGRPTYVIRERAEGHIRQLELVHSAVSGPEA
jgi:undecaprenyl-phosphate 4-deoxy-4-formamido-L-arabinose transferase